MICVGCGHENRHGAKFCKQCGAGLAAACPQCGTAVEPGDRFCDVCGQALTAMTVETAPPSSETIPVSGERKQITVLFADVAGSMDLQEQLDPEVWAEIIGRFVAVLAEGVRKYGGTVDKFTGDGIMALFGAPVAQEDHARRACHAAWQLTKTIGDYSDELRRDQGVELHVRLGLNSGEVIVGRVGDDLTLDPTALGHTVGLAQRMEAMAEPGMACLTEHTARLVEGWFHVRNLGPSPVKGATEPLGVYVLEGPVASPPILHSAGGLGSAPLVGRERELVVLEDALVAAEQGHAQVLGVVGEAGVGKSRLCDEFARGCAARGVMVRRTAGVSHGRDLPLLPILALLRDYFGVSENDRPEQAREKIVGRLLDLDPALEETLPLLFDFLEVPDPQRPAPKLAAEVRMRRIFETLHRVTQRRSEQETLVLVFEDLHWFDPQSDAFLERLIESFPGSRTLVITNFRPEFSGSWMRHSYYRQLPLAPLGERAVGALLGGLLGDHLSLNPLLSFVQERTGGNPFFVEEVVRTLIEDGTLVETAGSYRLTRPLQEVKVPPSLQAVLAARIDRLTERDKHTLQTAAVIGRTFSEPILRQVAGLDEQDLDGALSALRAAEFVQEDLAHPLVFYRFWHPLTQDVAYQGLLTEGRASLHAAVAQAIVQLDPDRLDERAAELAGHWEQAGRNLEAARWSLRAGHWALRTDVPEARRRWQAAVDLLEGEPDTPESLHLEVQAQTYLIRFGVRTGVDPDEAEQIYQNERAHAEKLNDTPSLARLVSVSGSAKAMAGDLRGALDRWFEAVHLVQSVEDPAVHAEMLDTLPFGFLHVGPLKEGLAWADRALAECATVDRARAATMDQYLHAAQFRATILSRMGRLPEAQAVVEGTIPLERSRSLPEHVAWNLSLVPELARASGENMDVLDSSSEAVLLAEETGNALWLIMARQAVALAHLILDHPRRALDSAEHALTEARSLYMRVFEPSLLTVVAHARLSIGDPSGSHVAADQAVHLASAQGARVMECPARLARAQARAAIGASDAPEEVLADLQAALALAAEVDAATYEPFIHEELGRLHHDEEKELREALRLYRQIGAGGHARRLEAELSMGGRE